TMTWIKVIPLSQANEELREVREKQRQLYPPEYGVPIPGLPDSDTGGIVASHSLIPEAMGHACATCGALTSADFPLSRRQHEPIATAVSQTNRTRYCSVSHREFLRRVTNDDELVRAFEEDPASAPLSNADRAIVDYAVQITKDATKIDPAW